MVLQEVMVLPRTTKPFKEPLRNHYCSVCTACLRCFSVYSRWCSSTSHIAWSRTEAESSTCRHTFLRRAICLLKRRHIYICVLWGSGLQDLDILKGRQAAGGKTGECREWRVMWAQSPAHLTQEHGGAIWDRKWFFRVMPSENHIWLHKEPFKLGFFKEPFS